MRYIRSIILLVGLTVFGCTTRIQPNDSEVFVIETDDHGNMLGCSWYCGAPPIKFTASSTLRDGINYYEATSLHDGKKSTSWVEGVDGMGVGESIIIEFNMTERTPQPDHALGINGFSIINGFARSAELWEMNGRVKSFDVSFNGLKIGSIELKDSIEPQFVQLPDIDLTPGEVDTLRLTIREVYRGSRFDDTAVSDIFFKGYGVH